NIHWPKDDINGDDDLNVYDEYSTKAAKPRRRWLRGRGRSIRFPRKRKKFFLSNDNTDQSSLKRDHLQLLRQNELAESIVLENKRFLRPPLEPVRFRILKDAIRSKYRIALNHWDPFYKNGLQRTLSQLLCDSRIKLKKQQQIMLSMPLPPAASTTMDTDSQTH
ncbi:unnamed protein product, partial [Didymodactylos carnosus]